MIVEPSSMHAPRARLNSFCAASTQSGLDAPLFQHILPAREAIERAFWAMECMPLLREHRPDMAEQVNALPRALRAEAISDEIQKRIQTRTGTLMALSPQCRQYRLANLVAAEFEYQFLFEDAVAADSLQHSYLFLNEIGMNAPALTKHFSQVGLFVQAEDGNLIATSFIAYDTLFRHGRHCEPLTGHNPETGLMNYVDFVELLYQRRDQVALVTPGFAVKTHTFESATTQEAVEETLQKMLENTPTHNLEPVSVSITIARNEPVKSAKVAATCALV